MPFVTPGHRKVPDPSIPGDRCYVWYRWMIDEWKKERCWTTADRIYATVMHPDESLEQQRAKELAWQVFFLFKVLPYEEEKMEENGDIE